MIRVYCDAQRNVLGFEAPGVRGYAGGYYASEDLTALPENPMFYVGKPIEDLKKAICPVCKKGMLDENDGFGPRCPNEDNHYPGDA